MVILTLNSVVWAGVVVGVAAAGSLIAFALGFAATAVLTTAVTVVLALRLATVRLRGVRELWRPLLKVGVGLGLAGVLVTGYVRLDQILVLELAGSRQAGLYGAAYRLLDQVQFIPISVMTTLFPMIAAAYVGNRERARELLQTRRRVSDDGVAADPRIHDRRSRADREVLVRCAVSGGGSRRSDPRRRFRLHILRLSRGPYGGDLGIAGPFPRSTRRLDCAVNATLNLLLIPRYGFLAAAWITLLTEVTVMSLSMRAVLGSLSMTPRFQRILRTLVAAAAMGLVTWVARLAGVPLAGLAAVAAITYLPALFLLGVIAPGEIRAVLRKDAASIGA